MEKFEFPRIEILRFENIDVITASSDVEMPIYGGDGEE